MFEFNFDNITEIDTKFQKELTPEASSNFSMQVDRNNLLRAISRVQNVVERRNIIPILANIRLEAKAGKLDLMATDMDIAASDQIVAHIEKEGVITLPAQLLYDIVRKLPEGSSITIKMDETSPGRVAIYNEKCNFVLPYLDAKDFPMIDQGVMPFNFKISSSELKSIIDKNKSSICQEETRYNLNGIYLHITKNASGESMMNAVATDCHRLSCFVLTVPEGAEKMPGIIIPKKAVLELRKIIEDTESDIIVNLSQTKIRFSYDGLVFISKLIDATFPEYEAFIPTSTETKIEINKKILVQAIDRVTTVSFDKMRSFKMIINKNKVEFLTLKGPVSNGDATEIAECISDLENVEFELNARYVLDIASAIDGETVIFKFLDQDTQILIQDKSDPSASFIVMPVRP